MRQILVGLDIRTVLPPVLLLRYVEVPVVPGHGSPVIAPASSVRHYDVGAVLQVRTLHQCQSSLYNDLIITRFHLT